MEETGRPRYSKQGKEKGNVADEADTWRIPMCTEGLDYGRFSNKPEKGSQKKSSTGSFASSPRRIGQDVLSTSPAGFKKLSHSPKQKLQDELRDGFRKFPTQDDHARDDNWREKNFGRESGRWRKDSFHESGEDVSRQRDDGGRGQRHARRQPPKEMNNDERAESVTQSAGSKIKKRERRRNQVDRDDDRDGTVIDESTLSEKELLGLQQAEERLNRDEIFRLKRRPRGSPNSTYSCMLCDVLLESISSAHKHIKEKWHKKLVREKREEEMLTALLPPNPSQVKAIDTAIENVLKKYGLSGEDLIRRQQIVMSMEEIIKSVLPECSLRLYGSSCTKFGFKDSDVNIDIQFPTHMHQPDVLLLVQESLTNSTSYIDLEADFHARVPVLVCREKQSGLLCKVSAGNDNAYLTTEHLAALANLEPCLTPLVIAFRHWAKICHIDHPEEGGLPPYVLALMVIYFLQQRKEPVLPVYLGMDIEEFSLNKLVDFRLTGVEDGHVLWEYNPSLDQATSAKEFVRNGKAKLAFGPECQREVAIGQLWVEMLRFYLLEFNMADHVISIRIKELFTRESKDWPKKRIAIEDPYSVKRNVARTLNSQLMYEYILHCLKTTYKYFASPFKKYGKLNKQNHKREEFQSPVAAHSGREENMPPDLDELRLIQSELDGLSIDSHIMNGTIVKHVCEESPDAVFPEMAGCNASLTEELTSLKSDGGLLQDNFDCIIEELVIEEPDGYEPRSGETESGNEENEAGDIKGELFSLHGNQLLGEESEDTDPTNLPYFQQELENEIESLSDSEGGLHTGTVDSDDLGLEESGKLDREDELGDSLHQLPGTRKRLAFESNNSDDEEEEEDVNHRTHLDSLTVEDELENMYTASGEEVLSDDDGGHSVHVEAHSSVKEGLNGNRDSSEINTPLKEGPPKTCSVSADQGQHEPVLSYEFSKLQFTRGKSPTVVCSLCKHDGHLKRDCPEDFKRVELDPLPPMTPKFLTILNKVCIQCFNDFSPDLIEEKARENILQNLEDLISYDLEGAKLSLFGSSKNGFGFKKSDLDICMTFEGRETAEGLQCIGIIDNLAKVLRKHPGLRNILPITTAKVPIVKFLHVRTGLEGDISLYNTLALHNTKLLAAYANIDQRVKHLCYTMKVFAKICDIGDASRGSLSSYAYTLMVLYFLQQRNPPIIPVLQEIYDGPKKPEVLVDGWNVYFFNDLTDLPNRWPEYRKNTESVGELWLGLLQFYTEEFDFKEHVICIRRKKLLTTFKKQWTSKYIVIEDPFDLNHNLGAGLSRRMTNFIMKAFINGRRVFGSPVKVFPSEYTSEMEYFFDPEVLTEGELAPNDRCCRICGKIGHFMKDCPLRRRLRQRHDHRGHEDAFYQRRHYGDSEIRRSDASAPRWRAENQVAGREQNPRQASDKWRKQDDREFREKRCFICGSEGHIKKECPQYKGSSGSYRADGSSFSSSPSAPSNLKIFKAKQSTTPQEDKRKQKQQKVFLSPQAGSLASKHMTQGRSAEK
ncbi:terminal uridylyltransferase 7 [Amia ocellicauda]|uniref:terminal uridylyltransferase 7 n=1 Tax=Amia ocellicauda TaxID=2972642 RepID=UPI003464A32C